MNCDHAAVLEEFERLLLAEGTALNQLDERLAERLGIPERYLQGYRIVSAALGARPDTAALLDGADVPLPLLRAAAAVDRIAQLASQIYRTSTAVQPAPQVAARHAAWILGAVLQLREQLRALHPEAGGHGR